MPWGGGTGGWGSTPWGDGLSAPSIPVFPSAVIAAVQVIGANLLRVDFNVLMKVDGILLDPSNYTITLQGSGSEVSPIRVISQTGNSTSYVLLKVTTITTGSLYAIDIANLRTTKGNTVDVANSASEFYGRITKLDFAQSTQQRMYTKEPDSVISSMLIAITSEDEKIGGTSE